MTTRDPFHGIQDRVTSNLSRLEGEIAHYRLNYESSIVNLDNFKQSTSTIQRDCDYLAQTNKIVESDPGRFPSINAHELQFRKAFVKEAQAKLRNCTSRMQRPRPSNTSTAAIPITGQSNNPSNNHLSNNTYVKSVRFEDEQSNGMQDVILTDMAESLIKLQNISIDIKSELVESDKMIDEMGESVDVAQDSMNLSLKKMDKLLMSSARGRVCCILSLVTIAVILLFIIIYV